MPTTELLEVIISVGEMKNQEGRYLKESRLGIVVDSPKSVVKLYQSVAQE